MIVFRVAWACFDMLQGYVVSRAAVQHSPHSFHRRKSGSIYKALHWYVFFSGRVLLLHKNCDFQLVLIRRSECSDAITYFSTKMSIKHTVMPKLRGGLGTFSG